MTRTVVVTGAAGGIGRAVVRRLLDQGDRVIGIVRTPAPDVDAEQLVLDLGQPFEVPNELTELGELHGLVHCAGIAEVAGIEQTGIALWERTLRVNLAAAAELTRIMLPGLREARGHVVFLNMANGARPVAGWSAYVASKAGLTQYADVLRLEERGLRVTTIYPGGTATELLAKVRAEFGAEYDPARAIRPDTIAEYVALVLSSPADAYPSNLTITAGSSS